MRRVVNSVDEPGSLTDKQKAALDKYGLPYNDETTSREGALAMARYHRELKKDRPKRRHRSRKNGAKKKPSRRYKARGLPVTKLTEQEYRDRLAREQEARSTKREGESE